jgi:hypothetical protein
MAGVAILVDRDGLYYKVVRITRTLFIVEHPISKTRFKVRKDGLVIAKMEPKPVFGIDPIVLSL